MRYSRIVLAMVTGVVAFASGAALVALHRRIARWHYKGALSVRPAESVLSLRAHTMFWLGMGVIWSILGILMVAGVIPVRW